jgi:hypothetical protein
MKNACFRILFLTLLIVFATVSCTTTSSTTTSTITTSSSTTSSDSVTSTTTTTGGTATTNPTTTTNISTRPALAAYDAYQISRFGSGTPAGTTDYRAASGSVAIWNTDASLDNYGGIQTPTLSLDFSKAVIFQMEVESVFTQYIVKLAVAGESEYYYVLAEETRTGLVSINVVDAMLSTKFRTKNTQPDPGYQTGWKYAGQVMNCSFHILAKGPDGERQTAELVVKRIAIYNDLAPITDVSITSPDLTDGVLSKLKGSSPVSLFASVAPSDGGAGVLWSSSDPDIASVDDMGVVTFHRVGRTTVFATSALDQSKQASVVVDVRSGYEDVGLLKTALSGLTYGGSDADAALFEDLFSTTWGETILQTLAMTPRVSTRLRSSGNAYILDNLFNSALSGHVNEAESAIQGSQAFATLTLSDVANATVYRMIDGKLYKNETVSAITAAYATKNGVWTRMPTYLEQGIVVNADGTATKYELRVEAKSLVADVAPGDWTNGSWIVPDRTKQSIDPVIHALSPATVALDGDLAVIRQNKYPEAKYNFGGIVSPLYTVAQGSTVELLLNVDSLNQKSEYVKTMWEIRILYYHTDGTTVVSSNPLKVASGNEPGLQSIAFVPAYPNFRLYLVVNGSDIGEQFPDATMRLSGLTIYSSGN